MLSVLLLLFAESMLDDPLIFGLAAGHLILSHLLTGLLCQYLTSRPTLSQTIITYLSRSLVLAYNLSTSLVSLGLLMRASWGPLPGQMATGCIFFYGLGFFCLIGLHMALAFVRYAAVTWFNWVQPQDYRQLGRRINFLVGCVSVVIMVMALLLRDPANKNVGIEAYLAGRPVHQANFRLLPVVIGCLALLGLVSFYLVCKWILQVRASNRIQPAAEAQVPALTSHIDIKSIVIGSFYALACCGLATALDDNTAFRKDIALTIVWLILNNLMLVFFYQPAQRQVLPLVKDQATDVDAMPALPGTGTI